MLVQPWYRESDCSCRPVGIPVSKRSGSRPSASRPTHIGFGWTSICVPARRFGPLGMSTGWRLTHVGEYEGDVVAANIVGESHPANYEAVPPSPLHRPGRLPPSVPWRHPIAANALVRGTKTATYSHKYAESNGFLTLLSDGARLTGAYALGPEAGEWLQQAILAVRARVPLEVLSDIIQPFPSFSSIFDSASKTLVWR